MHIPFLEFASFYIPAHVQFLSLYAHIYFANQVSFGHLTSSDYMCSFQLLAVIKEHYVKLIITLFAFDCHMYMI